MKKFEPNIPTVKEMAESRKEFMTSIDSYKVNFKFNPFTYRELCDLSKIASEETVRDLKEIDFDYFPDELILQYVTDIFTVGYGIYGIDIRKATFEEFCAVVGSTVIPFLIPEVMPTKFLQVVLCLLDVLHEHGVTNNVDFTSNEVDTIGAIKILSSCFADVYNEVSKQGFFVDEMTDENFDEFEQMGKYDFFDEEDDEAEKYVRTSVSKPFVYYIEEESNFRSLGIHSLKEKIVYTQYSYIFTKSFLREGREFSEYVNEITIERIGYKDETIEILTRLMKKLKKKKKLPFDLPVDYKERTYEVFEVFNFFSEDTVKRVFVYNLEKRLKKKPTSKPASSFKQSTLEKYLGTVPSFIASEKIKLGVLKEKVSLKKFEELLNSFLTEHYTEYRQTFSQVSASSVLATFLKVVIENDQFSLETKRLAKVFLPEYFLYLEEVGLMRNAEPMLNVFMDSKYDIDLLLYYQCFGIKYSIDQLKYK